MAFDAFIKIDDIPGDSTDENHPDEIEILSYSHSVSQQIGGSRSGGGAATGGRADHGDFCIVKELDSSTPKLNLACCDGTHIPNVMITLCRSGQTKNAFMTYKLGHVAVTSIRPGGSGGGDMPLEEVTLNYGKIEWEYKQTDPKTGKVKGTKKEHWDTTTNKGSS